MLDIFIPLLGETFSGGGGGGGGGSGGDPPSAAPSDPSLYTYAGTPGKWGAQWTNGDATATTQIDPNNGSLNVLTASAGTTFLDLGWSVSQYPDILDTVRLRHFKNGQSSDWVEFAPV